MQSGSACTDLSWVLPARETSVKVGNGSIWSFLNGISVHAVTIKAKRDFSRLLFHHTQANDTKCTNTMWHLGHPSITPRFKYSYRGLNIPTPVYIFPPRVEIFTPRFKYLHLGLNIYTSVEIFEPLYKYLNRVGNI